MSRIFKYLINPLGRTDHKIAGPVKFLSTHEQDNGICVWVELMDPNGSHNEYSFHAFPTGMEINTEGLNYLGTVLLSSGQFVNHVYYKKEGTN